MAEYKDDLIELLHKTIEEKDAQIQELQKTIQELNATVANLNETLEEFRRKFFGTSRERAAGRVPEEAENEEEAGKSTVRSHARRKPKAKREELYKNLPVREVRCGKTRGFVRIVIL